MHALIIEDEGLFAEIIEYVLTDCGFDTFDIVTTSNEAIAAAAHRRPDLITVDVTLAAGSGIEAIREICPESSMPVIFITGQPVAEVRAQVPNHLVLAKPISEHTLTYAVAASICHAV